MFNCKGCPDRRLHCHSECESYQKGKQKINEINKAKRLDKDADAMVINRRYSVKFKSNPLKRKNFDDK